jgi:hypothetical protein
MATRKTTTATAKPAAEQSSDRRSQGPAVNRATLIGRVARHGRVCGARRTGIGVPASVTRCGNNRHMTTLYEYLARPVDGSPESEDTSLTRADGDTYDDDAGSRGLSVPICGSDGTDRTAAGGDTYDDDAGVARLNLPHGADGTWFTKTDGETYDDDPGTGRLALPH